MNHFARLAVGALAALVLTPTAPAAQSPPGELRARRAVVAPVVDGVLDDDVWSGAPMPTGTWISYNPLRGEPAQQHTEVWIGYDDAAVYFAFRCRDTEATGIRTTVSRRDNVFNDDWIALSLDSSRAGQIAYHMFVNPSGVQMDALNTPGGEDFAADWVWESAGRVTDEGYVIEIRVPLESIRFKSGAEVRMGFLAMRRISRLGVSWSWPEMRPGTWVFESHVPVVFENLRQPLLLEVIPSLTVSRSQSRGEGRLWRAPDGKGDLGASVKYGITSTITFDATVNPDFSQIESDQFQVEFNERFSVFFDEKRPFFMEGLGLFNIAGTGDGSTMRTAVHTRRIVDPSAGVKLTGTAGPHSFGLLSAADPSTGDGSTRYTVARAVRNLAPAQHLGLLVADTEQGPAYNRVIGGDLRLRHGEHWRWDVSALSAHSRTSEGRAATHGAMAQASYAYQTRRVLVVGQLEHFGDDFRMDTAFFNQPGITRAWQYVEPMFYPDATGNGWLKRVAPYVFATRSDNRVQGGSEQYVESGLRFNFTRQGFLRGNIDRGHETFAGRRFDVSRARIDGNAQFLRWLYLSAGFDRGQAIFYDAVDPFGGTRTSVRFNAVLQPNENLTHDVSYTFVGFDRRATGESVFDLHIVNLRNSYQFNRQFFLRLIAQLDTSRRRVLGDALASYEFVPGTVVHLGYGAILEAPHGEHYAPFARALFFKASYLARF